MICEGVTQTRERATVMCIFKAVLGPFSWRAYLFGTLSSQNIQGHPRHVLVASPESQTSRESCSYLHVLPAGSRGTSS